MDEVENDVEKDFDDQDLQSLELLDYFSRPRAVTAVKVTERNIVGVAKWSGGVPAIVGDNEQVGVLYSGKGTAFTRPERLSGGVDLWVDGEPVRAFIGDYVVFRDGKFVAMQDREFHCLAGPLSEVIGETVETKINTDGK